MTNEKYKPIRASIAVDVRTQTITGSGMLLSDENIESAPQCLGVATIEPGQPASAELAHSTSEVMFVAEGKGELITTEGTVVFSKGDAIHIPADLRHALKNTGESTLVSVFSFPSPNRPDDSTQPH